MKIRNKILLSLISIWAIFIGITYFYSQHYFINTSLLLEKQSAGVNVERLKGIMVEMSNSLYRFNLDWANWIDGYNFIAGTNPTFPKNNIAYTTFKNSKINIIIYITNAKKVIFTEGYDLKKEQKIHVSPDEIQAALSLIPFINKKNVMTIDAYLKVGEQIIYFVISKQTDTDAVKTPNGYFVTGRIVGPEWIERASTMLKAPLQLSLVNNNNDSEVKGILESLKTKKKDFLLIEHDENRLLAFITIKDMNENTIGIIKADLPRIVYNTNLKSVRAYYFVIFVFLILFIVFIIYLLRIVIISRLEKLKDQLVFITNGKKFSQRIPVGNPDEIGTVSDIINHMLEIIEASQIHLEEKVKKRTSALLRSNTKLSSEINERKEIERELRVHKEHLQLLAHYDQLTNLPNRFYFNEMLNKALLSSQVNRSSLAVLFIDLERFKTINDALGHSTGDKVIQTIAVRLGQVLRPTDALARLGGDEFIILLPDIQEVNDASDVAARILTICSKKIEIASQELYVSASIGISVFPQDGETLEELQKKADIAMYKAKRSGGNSYQFFAAEMDHDAKQHIVLDAALRNAIANNELLFYFQPKLNLETNKIESAEALIRWEHPTLGLLTPDKFIPLAEQTNFIIQLGEWTIKEACRIIQKWNQFGLTDLQLAINLSAKQFLDPHTFQTICNQINHTNINPRLLEVEITETSIMQDTGNILDLLNRINSFGVDIAIDDFGTGFTSIGFLKKFPIKTIKVDMSFIRGIPENAENTAITSAVLALAKNLGINTVAEGVENEHQMRYLAQLGCHYVQGYFISRPVNEEKFLALITEIRDR